MFLIFSFVFLRTFASFSAFHALFLCLYVALFSYFLLVNKWISGQFQFSSRAQFNLFARLKNTIISRAIDRKGRVFANGLEDWGSISGQIIPKTQKMVLDTSLFNTQHYKVQIKGKVEQSRE